MSFSKEELQQFAKDYAAEEPDAAPAVVVDQQALNAIKNSNIAETLTPSLEPAPTTEQPKQKKAQARMPNGKFASKASYADTTAKKIDHPSKLFMIEGMVRLTDNTNRSNRSSEQKRIVWANDVDEAIQKYINYFTAMSDNRYTYNVVNAGGSEAIE